MSAATMRCAIYTRVSSDSGLEQDFNSLDAQREAAEAYIKSQAHEGWRLIRDHFDDGGFSGGSIERPALQKLLERIRERRIDIVVVYKVDRLTRSLADFAKLVELFDEHKVSFVSVTQAFNTTTSMGRLTLNVLLSFAQFEREVTGERIRDKIAASKQKGIWMGGHVPLGYRVQDRKLLLDEAEAVIVKSIFDLYLELGSIPAVRTELRQRGIKSRTRTRASGETVGGIWFTNGPISHILRNRHYLGEINHHGKSWPGEHLPIIDSEIFQAVQAKLEGQRVRRSPDSHSTGALLIGKIFDEAGERLSPTYAIKKGIRYRYYMSKSGVPGSPSSGVKPLRLPAGPIEGLALLTVREEAIADSAAREASAMANAMSQNATASSDRERVDRLVERLVVRDESVDLHLRDRNDLEAATRVVTRPWKQPSMVRRRAVLPPSGDGETHNGRMRAIKVENLSRLIRAIAIARRWLDELIDGRIAGTDALASQQSKTERSIRMRLSLAFLDPALIQATTLGQLPRGFGLARLSGLPPNFEDQWKALGLGRLG